MIGINSNRPRIPKSVAKHPQLLSAYWGTGSENSVIIKPISGVKTMLRRNDNPNPIRRREPIIPTRTAKNVEENAPNINNSSGIS